MGGLTYKSENRGEKQKGGLFRLLLSKLLFLLVLHPPLPAGEYTSRRVLLRLSSHVWYVSGVPLGSSSSVLPLDWYAVLLAVLINYLSSNNAVPRSLGVGCNTMSDTELFFNCWVVGACRITTDGIFIERQ